MRIHEVITESAELEEGWKSKLAGAALAGAAALGGGHAAHAQNHQPTAQTQHVQSQVPKEIQRYVDGTKRTSDAQDLAQTLGRLYPWVKDGQLQSSDLKLYNKFLNLLLKSKEYYDSGSRNAIDQVFNFGANAKSKVEPIKDAALDNLKRHAQTGGIYVDSSSNISSNSIKGDINAINPNVSTKSADYKRLKQERAEAEARERARLEKIEQIEKLKKSR